MLATVMRRAKTLAFAMALHPRLGAEVHPDFLSESGYENCCTNALERAFFFDNLLVRIHLIIEMIWWTGLAAWVFELPFPDSLISTFLVSAMPFLIRGGDALRQDARLRHGPPPPPRRSGSHGVSFSIWFRKLPHRFFKITGESRLYAALCCARF